MQRDDLAHVHVSPQRVVSLSDRDTDPEVLFDLEEAGGLSGLVADLLEHRVDDRQHVEVLEGRGGPVRHPHADSNAVARAVQQALGDHVAHEPLHGGGGKPGRLLDLAERHIGMCQGKGVEYLRDLAEHQQRLLLGRGRGVIGCHDANLLAVTHPDHCR